MIDTLNKHRARAERLGTPRRFGLELGRYILLTLHRPSNVDEPETFAGIFDALVTLQRQVPLLFPAHPRTVKRMTEYGFKDHLAAAPNLRVVEPQGYLEFLDLMMHAQLVLTDSGGIQEETTILGIPCLTLRENTERPITITEGTNLLVGPDPGRIIAESLNVLAGDRSAACIPELWDGQAAARIVEILRQHLG
jgi:UDP-N-acetylglucosamine 2-epimerase (non-hydrolysing)